MPSADRTENSLKGVKSMLGKLPGGGGLEFRLLLSGAQKSIPRPELNIADVGLHPKNGIVSCHL